MPKPEVTVTSALFDRGVCQFLTHALAEATKSNWQVSSNEAASDKPLNSRESACFRFSFTGALKGDALLLIQHDTLELLKIKHEPAAGVPLAELLTTQLFCALEGSTPALTSALSELGTVMVVAELTENPELMANSVIELWAT